jgi:hypothetical protein
LYQFLWHFLKYGDREWVDIPQDREKADTMAEVREKAGDRVKAVDMVDPETDIREDNRVVVFGALWT